MKIFIIEKHQYYKTENGTERYVPKEGRTPYVFTSRNRANQFFNEMMKEDGIDIFSVRMSPYISYEKKYTIGNTENRDVVTLIEDETF